MSGSGNSLVIAAGGQVTTTVATATVGVPAGGLLGYNAGSSNNSGLVTGPGSSWNISGASITAGLGGSGNSLVVSNGGHVTTEYTYISRGAGAADNSVVVTGSGSTLSNSWNMLVGVSGSGGSLVVSDGATIRSFIGQLGYNAGSSNNSALVTGSGSVWNNPNSYYGITVGMSGGATLTVANGGTVNLNSTGITLGLTLAEYAGSSGTLNIGRFGTNDAAGTVSTPKIGFGAGTGTINFNQSNSTTINAVISGNGSVNQLGSGTTILTGNYTPGGNTYSGTTTVSAGTLLASSASGSSAIGSSTLMVSNTGTFGGKGVVQGAATIASGGTLAVGLNGVGSLSFNGGLTLEAGSTTIFQIYSTSDFTSINLNGIGSSVTYGGTLVFNLINYTPVVGNEFTVFNMTGGAGESGNFATVEVGGSYLTQDSGSYGIWSGSNAGVTYQFSDSTGKLTVQAVPEPSTYALLGLGAIGIFVILRRRRFL
jgi:T5SS/PEP-CTERM-associated repeat protein